MIEIISSTATFGYAVLLIKYSKSRRTKGLPIPKKGQQPDLDNLKFHVRVLIPCYKESVDLVKLTVLGALKAPLPKDTLRTVYLCDDGKDPAKEEMVRDLNNEWGCIEYVSGRKRDPNGEWLQDLPAAVAVTAATAGMRSAHAQRACAAAVHSGACCFEPASIASGSGTPACLPLTSLPLLSWPLLLLVVVLCCRRDQRKVQQPEQLPQERHLQGLLPLRPPGPQDPQERGHGGV